MKYIQNVLIFCFLAISPVFSAAKFDTITDLGVSARHIGTGGIDGFSRSASAVFENPASLYRIDTAAFSFFTATVMNEARYNQISLVTDTTLGRFGVGYMVVGVSDLPHTGQNSQNEFYVKSLFDYQNSVLKLAYQNSIAPDLHVGGALVRYGLAYFDVAGAGHNMDLGLLWEQQWGQVSLSVKNLLWNGFVTYEDGKTERVATDMALGYGNRFFQEFDIMGQVVRRQDHTLLSAGLIYTPDFLPYVSLMAGYRDYLVLDKVKAKASVGLGLHLGKMDFYYAYEKSDHVEFDGKHYFSVDMGL